MKRVVVVAHCTGKDKLARNVASRLARQQRDKGAKVQAYRCEVCKRWHVGGSE